MAKKESTISVLLKLKDQFTSPLKTTKNAISDTTKQMKSAQNTVKKWGRQLDRACTNAAKKVASLALAFSGIGAAVSIAGIKSFSSSCMELAQTQLQSEKLLENALSNVESIAIGGSGAVLAAKQDLMDLASEIQKTGVIGDEVTLAGFSNLASFGLATNEIKALGTAMDDIVAKQYGLEATTDNAEQVATVLGKAMNGNYTSLTKLGVVVSDEDKKLLDSLSGEAKANKIAAIIESRVGGTNSALAQTDMGKIQQFANNWGDVQEEVGKKLLKLKAQFASIGMDVLPEVQEALLGIVDSITPHIQNLTVWIANNKEVIKSAIAQVVAKLKVVFNAVKTVVQFIVKHKKTILNILTVVGGALAGLLAVHKVLTFISAVKSIGSVIATIATSSLGPMLLAVMAIGAAVALIITHWDDIKAAIKRVGEWAELHLKPIFEKIADVVQGIIDKITAVRDFVMNVGDETYDTEGTTQGDTTYRGSIGANALGTSYWKGGLTSINEHGGEIVDLPSGTRVIPNDVSKGMVGNNTVNVTVNVQGDIIGRRKYAEELGEYIADRLIPAIGVV